MTSHLYDFIVVGGGTAGLVVATRLSEDPSQRILVLEAGADYTGDPRVSTPTFFRSLHSTDADWSFESEPQPILNGRSVSMNQGRALGGSSAINAQLLVPPTTGLVDSWGALGNEGWNWEALKGYFRKPFNFPIVDKTSKQALGVEHWESFQNGHGPVQLSFPGNSKHPIRAAWAETFKSHSSLMLPNPYIEASIGSFSALVSTNGKTKERSYATSAYYNPIKNRENLKVLTNATVEKILFRKSGNSTEATGV